MKQTVVRLPHGLPHSYHTYTGATLVPHTHWFYTGTTHTLVLHGYHTHTGSTRVHHTLVQKKYCTTVSFGFRFTWGELQPASLALKLGPLVIRTTL